MRFWIKSDLERTEASVCTRNAEVHWPDGLENGAHGYSFAGAGWNILKAVTAMFAFTPEWCENPKAFYQRLALVKFDRVCISNTGLMSYIIYRMGGLLTDWHVWFTRGKSYLHRLCWIGWTIIPFTKLLAHICRGLWTIRAFCCAIWRWQGETL